MAPHGKPIAASRLSLFLADAPDKNKRATPPGIARLPFPPTKSPQNLGADAAFWLSSEQIRKSGGRK